MSARASDGGADPSNAPAEAGTREDSAAQPSADPADASASSTGRRLLAQRYGGAEEELAEVVRFNAVIDTLLAHRSMRAYRDTPLPDGTLESLIAAAQSASTSSNLQAWSVVAIEDPARKARLAALAAGQAHIRACPLFLVWLADLNRLEQIAGARGLPSAGLDYLESFVVAVIDAALAAQNSVIAAESLGLGTVYIGAIRNRPREVATELRLPSRVFPVFGLCVGLPATDRPLSDVKPRLPQRLVLHHEQYDTTAVESDALAAYDRTMAAFSESHAMAGEGAWSARAAQRIAGAQSLSGRHELSDILHTLGFALR